jgi:hypothetical protein
MLVQSFFYKYKNFIRFKMMNTANSKKKKKVNDIILGCHKIEIISKMGRTIRSLGTSVLCSCLAWV